MAYSYSTQEEPETILYKDVLIFIVVKVNKSDLQLLITIIKIYTMNILSITFLSRAIIRKFKINYVIHLLNFKFLTQFLILLF
jgi:hypothetical protein